MFAGTFAAVQLVQQLAVAWNLKVQPLREPLPAASQLAVTEARTVRAEIDFGRLDPIVRGNNRQVVDNGLGRNLQACKESLPN